MKAISLWQPYASLVAHGLKRIETRSWSTSYRGPVLIHAARRYEVDVYHTLWQRFPEVRDAWLGEPPRGALVAVARLADVRPMAWGGRPRPADALVIDDQTRLERAVGDWQPGRYGWVLEDVRPLDRPIPCLGAQGLWEVRRVTEAGAAAYPKRLARELVAADFDRLKAVYDGARGAAREAGGAL